MTTDTFRRPRCRLVVSGSVINGCHSLEVSTSNFAQAGSFFVQVAEDTRTRSAGAQWSDGDVIDVSIQVGFIPPGLPEGAADWQELICGRVDRLRLDPVTGTTTLEGRDYAARLLDLPVSENFLNCTSSEVATQLAQRSGLSASVDQTSSIIGQYYQIEHARVALSRFSKFSTGWDLLSYLAQIEGFDLWVKGSELFFQSASSGGNEVRTIDFQSPGRYSASPSLNLSNLTLERSLALAGGAPISVMSWNSRQRKRVSAQSGGGSSSPSNSIKVVRPNLLQDTAQNLADGIYGQTLGHERRLIATMPGDVTLSPRDKIRLVGVGSSWDGDYRVDNVDREMTLAGGFVQRFTAKTVPS